jgi:hypothetical protein
MKPNHYQGHIRALPPEYARPRIFPLSDAGNQPLALIYSGHNHNRDRNPDLAPSRPIIYPK